MTASTIRVAIHPFASLREMLELQEGETLSLELPGGCRSEEMLAQLLVIAPTLGPYGRHLLMAREGDYLEQEAILKDGDTISLYPPLCGG